MKKKERKKKIKKHRKLFKITRDCPNYTIPRTRIKRRGGAWREKGKRERKKRENKRQLWKTVGNWSGATCSAASFASNDIACAPKSMVKQFAGHLHDILMQFAWVRGSGARTTRESIHPIFPTLHDQVLSSRLLCAREDVDRGYFVSIILSCDRSSTPPIFFSRINCRRSINFNF